VELSVSCRPLGGIAYLDTAAVAVAPSKHCPATRRFLSAYVTEVCSGLALCGSPQSVALQYSMKQSQMSGTDNGN
jgi:hypothetical protein